MKVRSVRELLFGPEGATFLSLVEPVVDEMARKPVRYTILDSDSFVAIATNDMTAGMKIYWSELLGRAHLAAATSMIRSARWCSGMEASHRASLFLPYCACFRGLIESAADTYDALRGVATTLATNNHLVHSAVRGEAAITSTCRELEDALIHFSYAHKPAKGAAVPKVQVAKTVADYLKTLTVGDSVELTALYAELCQFTHPAAHSVQYMLVHENENSMVFVGNHEEVRIEAYAEMHRSIFPQLFMYAFNASVMVLKVLRSFEVTDYHVQSADPLDLSGIPAWKNIATLLAR